MSRYKAHDINAFTRIFNDICERVLSKDKADLLMVVPGQLNVSGTDDVLKAVLGSITEARSFSRLIPPQTFAAHLPILQELSGKIYEKSGDIANALKELKASATGYAALGNEESVQAAGNLQRYMMVLNRNSPQSITLKKRKVTELSDPTKMDSASKRQATNQTTATGSKEVSALSDAEAEVYISERFTGVINDYQLSMNKMAKKIARGSRTEEMVTQELHARKAKLSNYLIQLGKKAVTKYPSITAEQMSRRLQNEFVSISSDDIKPIRAAHDKKATYIQKLTTALESVVGQQHRS